MFLHLSLQNFQFCYGPAKYLIYLKIPQKSLWRSLFLVKYISNFQLY